MAYTTIDKPSDYFNTKLYTGNGSSTHAITGVGFQTDWVWIKNRNGTQDHHLFDSVRSTLKRLESNSNTNEETRASSLTSYDSDGFTLGTYANTNTSSDTYVAWNWKAGTSFTNDASSTGIGTIDSTGSFNNDAGFSIVTYSGTGSNGTIKHGLNAKPKIILWKRTDNNAGAVNWIVQSTLFGNQTKLVLNTTEAFSTNSSFSQTDNWTSSLIDLKNYEGQNASNGTYVAYCFAEKKGYSKFGSYTGNGNADGTFVYTGFKPAFFLWKKSSSTGNWLMMDNKRSTFNFAQTYVKANASAPEDATSSDIRWDFLSNGLKCRGNNSEVNGSGVTYIYMAFAENPFVTSSGVPANAR
jgi:hypothetical protein